MIMEAVSVVGISAGVAVAVSALVKRIFGGKKDPCPKCGRKCAVSFDDEGRKVLACKRCSLNVVIHDKSRSDEGPTTCPRCSGGIECIGNGEWVCKGFVTRESIVEVRGESMTPQSLTTIKPCGWVGNSSGYGKTWR